MGGRPVLGPAADSSPITGLSHSAGTWMAGWLEGAEWAGWRWLDLGAGVKTFVCS